MQPGLTSWTGYEGDAGRRLAARYETLAPETLFAPVADLLPAAPARVLDIGAGSGRDAAWAARQGHAVTAVEPSATMRAEAIRRHGAAGIRWIDDALPDLSGLPADTPPFAAIFLSAVWMHLPPAARPRALARLADLLAPGGRLFFLLRMGPPDPARAMFPAPPEEISAQALPLGLHPERRITAPDRLGRAEIFWVRLVLRAPDG